jgi:hypothetical protein
LRIGHLEGEGAPDRAKLADRPLPEELANPKRLRVMALHECLGQHQALRGSKVEELGRLR